MQPLIHALRALDIPYTDKEIKRFSLYLSLLKKWSRAYNLTSLHEDHEIILKHFVDSLLYLKALHHNAETLLDIGTGAGFPGIPIKIMIPPLKVYLLEPSRKKTSFLKNLIRTLSLNDVYALQCRSEDYPCSYSGMPEKFDVVVTRALFGIEEFVQKASHLCKEKGEMIISKGPSYRREVPTVKDMDYRVIRPDLSKLGFERFLFVVTP